MPAQETVLAVHRCGKCGGAVLVTREAVARQCAHADAPIVAQLSARCAGKGGLR